MNLRIYIGLIHVVTGIIPFVTSIIWNNDNDIFKLAITNVLCCIILIITSTILIVLTKEYKIKFIFVSSTFVGFFVFLIFHLNVANVSNFYQFQIDKSKYFFLHSLVKDEKFKTIFVSRDQSIIRIDNIEFKRTDTLSHTNISNEKLEIIASKMNENKIIYIHKDNEIVYITNGGFIDSESGYAYCESNARPLNNQAGTILKWSMVDFNWYYWFAD